MKSIRLLTGLALAMALVVAPGCTGVAAPGPTAPTTRGTGAVSGDWAGVGAFADAVMADDLTRAATYVVPGSPAARYLRFQGDFLGADPARRTPSPGSWAVNVDRHLGQVTIAVAGAPAVQWTDWRFAPDGKILQWSTPTAGALESRLWTDDSIARGAAGTVRLASALENDTVLNVVVEVTATRGTLTPDCGARYTPPAAAGPSASAGAAASASAAATDAGHAGVVASGCFGAQQFVAGKPGRVALQFDASPLGGSIAYALKDASGAEVERLTLAVR